MNATGLCGCPPPVSPPAIEPKDGISEPFISKWPPLNDSFGLKLENLFNRANIMEQMRAVLKALRAVW